MHSWGSNDVDPSIEQSTPDLHVEEATRIQVRMQVVFVCRAHMLDNYGPSFLLRGTVKKMEYLVPTHQLAGDDEDDWLHTPVEIDPDAKASFHFIQSWDGVVRYYLNNPQESAYARRIRKAVAAALSTRLNVVQGEVRIEENPDGRLHARYNATVMGQWHHIRKEFDVVDEAKPHTEEGVEPHLTTHGVAMHDVDWQAHIVERTELNISVNAGNGQDAAPIVRAHATMWRSQVMDVDTSPNVLVSHLHATHAAHHPYMQIDGKTLRIDTLLSDHEERAAVPLDESPPEPQTVGPLRTVLGCYDRPLEPQQLGSRCFRNLTDWVRRSGLPGLAEVRHYLLNADDYPAAPRRSVWAALKVGHTAGLQQLLADGLQGRLSPDPETYNADFHTLMYVLVDLPSPSEAIVDTVRNVALRLGGALHADLDDAAAAQTQRKAALMLGTLANRLYREGKDGAALLLIDDILDHMEAHLDSDWYDGGEEVDEVVCKEFRRHGCLHLNRTANLLEHSYFPHSVFLRALENAGHPAIVQHVARVLDHPYAQMRAEAVRALRRVAHVADASGHLLRTFRDDESHGVHRVVVQVYRADTLRRPPREVMDTFEDYLFVAHAHPEVVKVPCLFPP